MDYMKCNEIKYKYITKFKIEAYYMLSIMKFK